MDVKKMNNRIILICIAVLILSIGYIISSYGIYQRTNKLQNDVKELKSNYVAESKTPSKIKTLEPGKAVKAPYTIYDQNGLSAVITKIENKDTLKIFVSYDNQSGEVIDLTESLCKIVADGRQEECDTLRTLDFISEPMYELENGVKYDSILVFDKIESKTFDLVFSVNFEEMRANMEWE